MVNNALLNITCVNDASLGSCLDIAFREIYHNEEVCFCFDTFINLTLGGGGKTISKVITSSFFMNIDAHYIRYKMINVPICNQFVNKSLLHFRFETGSIVMCITILCRELVLNVQFIKTNCSFSSFLCLL